MRGTGFGLLLSLAIFATLAKGTCAQVVFATEGNYPPWNERDANGRFEGFDIDYVHAICDALKEGCEIVGASFPGMLDLLAGGRFDAIISGIAITRERERTIDFSRPYMQLSVSFATHASSPLAGEPPRSEAELIDRLKSARIGVQDATVNARLAGELLPDAKQITFDNQEALDAALAGGELDAALAATQTWKDPKTTGNGRLVIVGPAFTSADYPVLGRGLGIGVAKENRSLKDALDRVICELGADGTAAALSQKWFGEDLSVSCN
jgi:ABC-type amino acid transport substrate-binding protein